MSYHQQSAATTSRNYDGTNKDASSSNTSTTTTPSKPEASTRFAAAYLSYQQARNFKAKLTERASSYISSTSWGSSPPPSQQSSPYYPPQSSSPSPHTSTPTPPVQYESSTTKPLSSPSPFPKKRQSPPRRLPKPPQKQQHQNYQLQQPFPQHAPSSASYSTTTSVPSAPPHQERCTCMPGWAALMTNGQEQEIHLEVHGYAYAARKLEQASRSQRMLSRIAKQLASLPSQPNLNINAQQNVLSETSQDNYYDNSALDSQTLDISTPPSSSINNTINYFNNNINLDVKADTNVNTRDKNNDDRPLTSPQFTEEPLPLEDSPKMPNQEEGEKQQHEHGNETYGKLISLAQNDIPDSSMEQEKLFLQSQSTNAKEFFPPPPKHPMVRQHQKPGNTHASTQPSTPSSVQSEKRRPPPPPPQSKHWSRRRGGHSRQSSSANYSNLSQPQINALHQNFTDRLCSFFSLKLENRKIRIKILINNNQVTLIEKILVTGPGGVFSHQFVIPWSSSSRGPPPTSLKVQADLLPIQAFAYSPSYPQDTTNGSGGGSGTARVNNNNSNNTRPVNKKYTSSGRVYKYPPPKPPPKPKALSSSPLNPSNKTSLREKSVEKDEEEEEADIFEKFPNRRQTFDVLLSGSRAPRIISDIDDTIKHTDVLGGVRSILKNVFAAEHNDTKVSGMSKWYRSMKEQGAIFHYVSNAPMELCETLKDFLSFENFPSGSLRLKQYSHGNNFFSDLWESAADRKRPGVEDILQKFQDSKFILIGDSGEQDIQLYVEMAQRYPNSVRAIFIRDVTTFNIPPQSEQTSPYTGPTPASSSSSSSFSSSSSSSAIRLRAISSPNTEKIDFRDNARDRRPPPPPVPAKRPAMVNRATSTSAAILKPAVNAVKHPIAKSSNSSTPAQPSSLQHHYVQPLAPLKDDQDPNRRSSFYSSSAAPTSFSYATGRSNTSSSSSTSSSTNYDNRKKIIESFYARISDAERRLPPGVILRLFRNGDECVNEGVTIVEQIQEQFLLEQK